MEEIHDGVDLDSEAVRELKYWCPNMVEHDIADHLADDELRFIGEELSQVEYNNLPVEEQARSRAFTDAWASAAKANAASGNGGEAEEDE